MSQHCDLPGGAICRGWSQRDLATQLLGFSQHFLSFLINPHVTQGFARSSAFKELSAFVLQECQLRSPVAVAWWGGGTPCVSEKHQGWLAHSMHPPGVGRGVFCHLSQLPYAS